MALSKKDLEDLWSDETTKAVESRGGLLSDADVEELRRVKLTPVPLAEARKIRPEAAIKGKKVNELTGIDAILAAERLPQFERDLDLDYWKRVSKESPKTTNFMESSLLNGATFQDEVPLLQGLERGIGGFTSGVSLGDRVRELLGDGGVSFGEASTQERMLSNPRQSAQWSDTALKALKAARLKMEQAGVLFDDLFADVGGLLTSAGAIPTPEGATPEEVKAAFQRGSPARESLKAAQELYAQQPSERRLEIVGRILDSAHEEGRTLAGMKEAAQYLVEHPDIVPKYLLEIVLGSLPETALGGWGGAKIGAKVVWESLSATTKQLVVKTLGIAGATGGGTFGADMPMEFSSRYEQNGGDIDEAMRYALTKSTADAATNFAITAIPLPGIGTGALARTVTTGALAVQQGLAGAAGATVAAESVGETARFGEQVLEFALEIPGAAVDIPVGEYMARREAAAQAQMTRVSDALRAQTADANSKVLTELITAAQQSQVLHADPSSVAEAIQSLAEDSQVSDIFLDSEALRGVFAQSGQNPLSVFPSLAGQVTELAAAGGVVSVPLGEFVAYTAANDASSQLLDIARTSAGGMTLLEAQEFSQGPAAEELKQDIEKILAKQEGNTAFVEGSKKVHDDLVAQMNLTQRFVNDVGAAQVAPLHAFYVALADRLGETPDAVYARYQTQIRAAPLTDPTFDQVFAPATIEDFTPGAIKEIHRRAGWHILTAENPMGRAISPEENASRNAALEAELKARGYQIIPTEGKYTDLDNPADAPLEHGFLVFGMPREEAQQLGKQFEQDSILDPVGLVYHDNTAEVATGVTEHTGEPPANYYTRVPSTGAMFTVDIDFEGGRKPLGQVLRQSVSTRVPSQKAGRPDPHLNYGLDVDYGLLKGEDEFKSRLAAVISAYPNFHAPEGASADEVLEKFIQQGVDNLTWLYNQVPASTRKRSKLWYVGGRRIVDDLVYRFGGRYTDVQLAAVLAVFSPQTKWDINVTRAERLVDIYTFQQDTMWTPEMDKAAAHIALDFNTKKPKANFVKTFDQVRGKRLRELPQDLKAWWIRAYDQAHNPRHYRLVTPEGGYMADFYRINSGAVGASSWPSFSMIQKAVSVLEDGSMPNVSLQLGNEHKVRNFYNNIFDPSDSRSVTVDTHAVSAAWLVPMGGSEPEVLDSLGAKPKHEPTGLSGTYVLYAEMYRRAAAAKKLLPREMQSITWEALRGLFTDNFKAQYTKSGDQRIHDIWGRYNRGELTLKKAQDAVLAAAGGIIEPRWVGHPTGLAEGAQSSSYLGTIREAGGLPPTVSFAQSSQQTDPRWADSFERIENFDGLRLRHGRDNEKVQAASAYADTSFYFLPGVRRIPLDVLTLPNEAFYEAPPEKQRIKNLAAQIKKNGGITPVLVTQDTVLNGLRLSEGQHRVRALRLLGYDSVPARVALPSSPSILYQSPADASRLDGVVGVHFSYEPRTQLLGRMARLEQDNAESRRLRQATDTRIQQRVNFYVSDGRGITPELKVGPHAHVASLANLYDADLDPLNLFRNAKSDLDFNDAESGVIDAGFAGYLRRSAFSNQGAAVLLGDQAVDVAYVGGKAEAQDFAAVPPPPPFSNLQVLSHAILGAKNLVSGQQDAAGWAKDLARHYPEIWTEVEASGVLNNLTGSFYKNDIARALYTLGQTAVFGQASINAAAELRKAAEKRQPRFREFMAEIEAAGFEILFPPAGQEIKSEARLAAKITKDYNGDASKVTDVLRATVLLPDRAALTRGEELFRGVSTVIWKDTIQNPTGLGYRAVRLVVSLDGFPVEIQLVPSQIQKVKEEKHANYERFGDLTPEETQELISAFDAAFNEWNSASEIGTDSSTRALTEIGRPEGASHAVQVERSSLHETGMSLRSKYFITSSLRHTLYQDSVPDTWYFSQLSRMVEGAKQTQQPASQWKAWIKANAQKFAVKAGELEWSGVLDWLDLQGKEKVTKDALMKFLDENGVRVEDVVLGKPKEDYRYTYLKEYIDVHYAEEARWTGLRDRLDDAEYDLRIRGDDFAILELADDLGVDISPDVLGPGPQTAGAPRYTGWQLPGGKNYRELLLTLPGIGEDRFKYAVMSRDRTRYEGGTWDTREEAERMNALLGGGREIRALRQEGVGQFRSSHFDTPNILAHVRFNERVDVDGGKVLFLEEVQSDWGQAGLKRGFSDAPELKEGVRIWEDEAGRFQVFLPRMEYPVGIGTSYQDALRIASTYGALKSGYVPPAPFVTDTKAWVGLALKRMIAYAAENGFDKIAWTTGEQQANRYDLSKQVDRVSYFKKPNGKFHLVAQDKSGREVELGEDNSLSDVESKVGKDLAEKISRGEGAPSGGDFTDLRGIDLKVGGEGMQAFYDRIVPQVANDLLKKLGGGRVGEVRFGEKPYFDKNLGREVQPLFAPQIGFDITPALREKALSGLPLFQGRRDRGQISFAPDITQQPSIITLLAGADLSTFHHESGHFFFEVYRDVATKLQAKYATGETLTTGEQEILSDMNTLLAFIGVSDLAAWNNMTVSQRREGHEKVARGYEAFLFEGRAPSLALKQLFQRFKAWMTAVYRDLVKLNVELTDDVKQVYGRMLATRQQIEAAEQAHTLLPLFETKPAGMSDAAWLEYQAVGSLSSADAEDRYLARSLRDMRWLTGAKARVIKALQKDAAEARKALRREVEAEVNAMPVYVAQRLLKHGEIYGPYGEEIKLTEGNKLSITALQEMYPEGGLVNPPNWPRLGYGKYGMLAKEGLHPDIVAEMTGFTSGDDLVRSLLEAQPRRDVVEGRTSQRMLERYGDLTDPEAIERAADEAVHNLARGRFIATEMNALREMTGQPRLLARAAKDYAAGIIDNLRIRDLKPAKYQAAENRAAAAAAKALAADDLATAAARKRDQVVNFYAAKAAMDAASEVESGARYLKKFESVGSRKNIDPEYLDQIDQVLERFDLRVSQTMKAIDKRASLAEWAAAQEAAGFSPVVPEFLLAEARRVHYRNLSVNEFRGVLDTVKNIEHLGRLKKKLLTAKDAREFAAVAAAVETSIRQHANRTVKTRLESNTAFDHLRDGLQEFGALHRKLASLVNEMDGGQDGGVFWNTLIRPMNEAGAHEAVLRETATIKLMELLRPAIDKGGLKRGLFIPEIGASLSYEGRLMVALNWGNEGNRQRLMDGDNWTEEQVVAVMRTLSEEDLSVVQNVWDYLDTYRPAIAEQQKRHTGVEPKWIEPAPFEVLLPSGKIVRMRGGYLPAKYDTTRSLKSLQQEAATGLMEQWRGAQGHPKTRDSFTKERAAKVVERPLRKDLGVVFQHVTEVTHRLAWQDWLLDANRLLSAKPITSAILDHYGMPVMKSMRDAVEDIAAGDVPAQNAFEASMNHIRTGATVAGMAWNMFVSFLQPLGLTQSMSRIGVKWVGRGLSRWVGTPQHMTEVAQWVYDRSPTMRLRGKTFQREISELRNTIKNSGDFSIFDPVPEGVKESYFWFIAKAQQIADIPTWIGAYEKALATNPNESLAAAQADQAVLDSQGGGQIKDLAGIQRGGPLLKLFTNFYSYFSATYNLAAQKTRTTSFNDAAQVGRLAVDYMLLMVLPSVLATLMREAFKDECREGDYACLAEKLAKDQTSYLLGTVVGLRDLGSMIQGFDYSGPVGLRFYSDLAKLYTQVGQGEVDAAALKALNNTAGVLFHYPAGQVQKTVEGAVYMADEGDPNPARLLFGKPAD